jgi:hypothetical protein
MKHTFPPFLQMIRIIGAEMRQVGKELMFSFLYFKNKTCEQTLRVLKPGVVVHIYNPSTQESGAGGS